MEDPFKNNKTSLTWTPLLEHKTFVITSIFIFTFIFLILCSEAIKNSSNIPRNRLPVSVNIHYHNRRLLSPKFQAIYNNYRKLFSFRNNNDYLIIYSKMTMIEECLLEDCIKTYEPFIQNIELPYGRFYISAWS